MLLFDAHAFAFVFAAVVVVAAGVTHASLSTANCAMVLFVAAGCFTAGVEKSKRSSSPEDGFDAAAGAAAGGCVKKLLLGAVSCGAAALFFIPDVRFANGLGFAAGGAAGAPNPRLLNASLIPPNAPADGAR